MISALGNLIALLISYSNSKRPDVGKAIETSVGYSITLKVGNSLITMNDAGGISINGTKITVTMNDLFRVLADLAEVN